LPEYLDTAYDPDKTLKWHRGLAKHYQCPLITWDQAEDLATGLVPYKKPEPK
jgi:3'-phosphoadenosine 5'-phosphosulfate sulfotransferase (PAPS reductase)/FAD synthetase